MKISHKVNQELRGKAAKEILWLKYKRIAASYVWNFFEADDVIQNTALKVLQNLDKFDENKGSLEVRLTKIVVRQSIDYLRKKNIRRYTWIDKVHHLSEKYSQNDVFETESHLKVLIDELPAKQKKVFELNQEWYSHEEISKLLDYKGDSSSRWMLAKAKKQLRQTIVL